MWKLTAKYLLWLAAGACAASVHAEPKSIVIFHTNDIHGHFTAEPASWRDDKALVGGFSALSGQLRELRASHPESIYLDAGDLMTGNPVCNIEYNGILGGALLDLLSRVHVDAMCLGNHEFDIGADHVRAFAKSAKFPILCANVVNKSDSSLLCPPSMIMEKGGLHIGIIGLILEDLAGVVARKNMESFQILAIAQTAQTQIDSLDPLTDLIVLLTHNGVEYDSILATNIHNADVIVGGHSHTRLKRPNEVNGVIIVQAGSYCTNLGQLELTVDDDRVTQYDGKLIELELAGVTPNPDVKSRVDSLDSQIKGEYGEVIGRLHSSLERSYYSTSPLGNWLCDLLRARFNTDVAFLNTGGIRKDLSSGPIRKLDIVEMLPFTNNVVTFTATGAELETIAKKQASGEALHTHGIVDMSGMTVKYHRVGDNIEISEIKIGDKPLNPSQDYTVASIDYVTQSQPEQYFGFQPGAQENSGLQISDLIMQEIAKQSESTNPDTTKRLIEIK